MATLPAFENKLADRRRERLSYGRRVAFEPTQARFVRLTLLHNSANTGMHVAEIQVLGAPPR